MKRTLAALALVMALGGVAWLAFHLRASRQPEAGASPDTLQYDFEAEGVVLRQLDAAGRVQYEIEAERIVQLRNAGGIIASRLTLRHDPPASAPGGPQQWLVTAEQARVPPDGRVITLTGSVHARGSAASGGGEPMELRAAELNYDIEAQQVYTAGEVEFRRGGTSLAGRGLTVNVAEGVMRLESGYHATISF
jgi:LPS export ABC transporter protein LptC